MAKESPSAEESLAMGMTCAFHNLRRASRAVTQVYDAYFDGIQLKATQFTVLAALLYEKDGRPSVTDLATALVLEQWSLSRNLAVLERVTEALLYDDASRKWTPMQPLAIGRVNQSMTLLPDGRVLVAGGLGESGEQSSCEMGVPPP